MWPAVCLLGLLALVAGSPAQDRRRDYGDGHTEVETLTTYTTVTTCPVTSTWTDGGTTYTKTHLTTSTIIVTECPDCEDGGVITVPGPTVTATTTDVEITYETICPTTETVYGPTETYVTTYTTTNIIKTHIPTTIYETVPGEDVHVTETDVEYSTYTTVCPVTETTTLDGEEHIVTYTTTDTITTKIHTTVYETVTGGVETITNTVHKTVTTTYPVTEVTTISGEETTVTYTKTKTLETKVPTTTIQTVTKPGHTASKTDVHWVTEETTYPVTEKTVVSGSQVITTYHATSTQLVPTQTTGYDDVTSTIGPTGYPTAGAELKSAPRAAALMMMLAGAMILV